MMNRSSKLARTLSALLLATLACTSYATGTLNVYNWNDYIADNTIANFTKQHNVQVKYDLYDKNETLQAKLLTGASGYDVVYPSLDFASNQIKAGVFLKLDKSKLPNLSNLNPEFLKKLQAFDPGNQHILPYMWGTMAFGINADKVKKALGKEPMPEDMWELVFNPRYTSKLKSCGISFIEMPKNLFSMVNMSQGRLANDFSSAAIQANLEVLKKVRKDIRVFNDSPIDLLANGDVCVALAYNGDVYIAKDRAKEAGKPQKIEYVVPAKGTILWIDVMGVPRDSKNLDNAYLWLNEMLNPSVIAEISNKVNYANPNAKATTLVKSTLREDPKIYFSDAALATLQPLVAVNQQTQAALTKAFDQFKRAK